MIIEQSKSEIYGQPNCVLPYSFFEGRVIPSVHEESMDFVQWWDEQIRRCREGWRDGGYYAPPAYYYHLNFKGINMLDVHKNPVIRNPYYSEDDRELFMEAETARNNHQGMFLLTGRGYGKSYFASTLVEHEFTFSPASECFVSASTLPFVDLLFAKVRDGLNTQPATIRHLLLTDSKNYIESGYVVKEAGNKKIKGYRSKIRKVAYDDDPGKTRGTRPNIHIFEEVGSWTGAAKLIQCYRMTEASWKRGSIQTCFPLLIGTGGEMETGGSEDAKKMFYNPEAYNLRAYATAEGQKVGKFIPTYVKLGGYYEESGISDEKGARIYKETERERKKSEPEMYMQEIQEFPFTVEEAFTTRGGDWLPLDLINDQMARLYKEPNLPKPIRGKLRIKGGSSYLTPNSKVEFIPDKEGPVWILEHPKILEGEDRSLDNLNIAGCDSFDAVAEAEKDSSLKDERSRGCVMIYKRFYSANDTGNMFTAMLLQRTPDDQEFYKNAALLCVYYNANMLYEHTKMGIARYFITNKLSRYLMKRPKLEQEGIIKRPSATNTYGLQMPVQVKQHIIKLYKNYIKEYSEQMFIEEQLIDARDFRFGSPKFDITMAAAIALCADDELYNVEIRESKKEAYKWPVFQTNSQGHLEFK